MGEGKQRIFMHGARIHSETDVLIEGNCVVTQRNIEELDAAKHRLTPGFEALRRLARFPIEVLPRLF